MVRTPLLSLVVAVSMALAGAAYGQTEQTSGNEQNVVSASTLKRVHAVPPSWPASAAAGVEGWVVLRFTLLPNGTVSDVEVTEAHPAGVFETSAVEALRQWTYEPVEHNGKKIAQRAEIRMKYAQQPK